MSALFGGDLPEQRRADGRHLVGAELAATYASLEEQAQALECWETPPWAVDAILRCELLTPCVLDPCCGTGIIARGVQAQGYDVLASDIVNWGYDGLDVEADFVTGSDDFDRALHRHRNPEGHRSDLRGERDLTVIMNPPFSRACEFVERAKALGARKIVCFQRWAWIEGEERNGRRPWWDAHPVARVWPLGQRATCWLFTVPPEERKGSTPTAHAWYVWERAHPHGWSTQRLYRDSGRDW